MIDVRYTDESGVLGVTITGHADAAPRGSDLYCAAVTALEYTLAQCVLNARHALKGRPKIRLNEGDVVIKCRPKGKYRDRLKNTFDDITTGFDVLAHNFPDKVQFTVIDPRGKI